MGEISNLKIISTGNFGYFFLDLQSDVGIILGSVHAKGSCPQPFPHCESTTLPSFSQTPTLPLLIIRR